MRRIPLILFLLWTIVACGDTADEPAPPMDVSEPEEVGLTPDTPAPPPDVGPDTEPAEDTLPGELPGEVDTSDAPGLEENFGEEETEGSIHCEGLNQAHCLFPFPSDYFRKMGEAGAALTYPVESLPQSVESGPMDPSAYAIHDGFSTITPILFRFEGGTVSGTTPVTDIGASVAPESPTLLIRAATGESVPHWVELDHFTVAEGAPVYVLRPAQGLQFDERYVVAVRGLVDAEGALLEADPGFVALRDQLASKVRGVHGRRQHFETNVFPVIEAAGAERAALQLAFDFTTVSKGSATTDLVTMRERMLEAIGTLGPEYEVTAVEEPAGDANIAQIIRGTAKIPSFLLPAESELSLRRLRYDADGKPAIEGFELVPFVVQIPHSVKDSDSPSPVLQYGHGLFGTLGEANNGWLREMAQRHGFVILASDLSGLSESDIGTWGVELSADLSVFPVLWEKVLQGLVNQVALVRMAGGRLANDHPEIDPSRLYYYGNSQGGTMGNIMMALHSDVTRGVLGVPGCAYSMLLNRSVDFIAWAGLLKFHLPDVVDFVAMFGLLQTAFNRMEPLSYVHLITDEPIEGGPEHRVLLHVAKEDAQVQNDVSFVLARSIGAVSMAPAVRPIWGLEEQEYPYEGNAMVEYDFGMPENPNPTEPPPAEYDTHGHLRKLEIAQDQLWHFLETGEMKSFCDGACDPD